MTTFHKTQPRLTKDDISKNITSFSQNIWHIKMTFHKTQLHFRKQLHFTKHLRKYNSTGNSKQNDISKNKTTFHKTQHLTKHIDISVNTFYKTNNVTVFCDFFFFVKHCTHVTCCPRWGFFFPNVVRFCEMLCFDPLGHHINASVCRMYAQKNITI